MKRKRGIRGFTLLEIIVVISIIALLAALLLGNGDSVSSKRRLTQSTLQTIQSALERYHSQYGEYPEPVNADETAEIMPGKAYPIGAARCLYQALRGDGSDAIKEVGTMEKSEARSDGTIDADEVKNSLISDMPQSMWRKVGGSYILVDAFGHPFQYLKADGEKKSTVNATYDLWSCAEDEKNVRAKSKDTEANTSFGAKWIKNW